MGLFDYFKKKKELKQKKDYEDRMEEKKWIDCMIITGETREHQKEYQKRKLKDADGRIIGISNKRMGKDWETYLYPFFI